MGAWGGIGEQQAVSSAGGRAGGRGRERSLDVAGNCGLLRL